MEHLAPHGTALCRAQPDGIYGNAVGWNISCFEPIFGMFFSL